MSPTNKILIIQSSACLAIIFVNVFSISRFFGPSLTFPQLAIHLASSIPKQFGFSALTKETNS
uniref:Transmembrane protein n=2 Tax=Arabidopsis thaliana TaxID=3702 RepID=Q1PFK6_ARATH|nr:hypothetical protein At1g53935 [Arabidopsis thaliana]